MKKYILLSFFFSASCNNNLQRDLRLENYDFTLRKESPIAALEKNQQGFRQTIYDIMVSESARNEIRMHRNEISMKEKVITKHRDIVDEYFSLGLLAILVLGLIVGIGKSLYNFHATKAAIYKQSENNKRGGILAPYLSSK